MEMLFSLGSWEAVPSWPLSYSCSTLSQQPLNVVSSSCVTSGECSPCAVAPEVAMPGTFVVITTQILSPELWTHYLPACPLLTSILEYANPASSLSL